MTRDESQVARDLPLDALEAEGKKSEATSFKTLLDVSIPVVIEIGRTSMTIQDVLQVGIGSVIELDRAVGEPVDIFVSDRKFAHGEIVVVGDHFGVRITRMFSDAGDEADS